MSPKPEEPTTKSQFMHCKSKLDPRFSYGETGSDSNSLVEADAIHKAVAREPWTQVSYFCITSLRLQCACCYSLCLPEEMRRTKISMIRCNDLAFLAKLLLCLILVGQRNEQSMALQPLSRARKHLQ